MSDIGIVSTVLALLVWVYVAARRSRRISAPLEDRP